MTDNSVYGNLGTFFSDKNKKQKQKPVKFKKKGLCEKISPSPHSNKNGLGGNRQHLVHCVYYERANQGHGLTTVRKVKRYKIALPRI